MKLYNTMTKQKEEFVPLEENKVSMYVCGPTVYNYIHIGNARSAVAFDTIRRYFEFKGYQVNYVSNFTDVDDKIINYANANNMTPQMVANKFIEAFYEDTKALNVKKATLNPRVMESIDDIIQFILDLIIKDYAYERNGNVYYRTKKFAEYGKLSGQSLAELEVGASQRTDEKNQEEKDDPLDFVLWKVAKPNEISWQSPWGLGRPGWHIECSVMATKYLGATIDIHAGGQDLMFPHHENEIAQSQAHTDHVFANYWLHNGFVTFDGEKMSKSIGNVVLVHELIKQIDPQVIRFLLVSAHYRHPLAFSDALLKEAEINLKKLKTAYHNLSHRLKTAQSGEDELILANFLQLKDEFIQEMDDDINVPNGLTVVYKMSKDINIYSEKDVVAQATVQTILDLYKNILTIFGIEVEETIVDEDVLALIEERTQARQNKDFKRSDEIRDYLKTQGIILDDTAQGTRFKRI